MKRLDKMQRGCVLLFTGVFGVFWCWLLLAVTLHWEESKKICLLAGSAVLIMALGVRLLKKFAVQLWEKEKLWNGIAMVLLFLMAAGMLYAGMELRVYPSWDFGAVYQGAVEIVEDGVFSESSNWYFTTYPNNVAVCLLLAGVFELFGGLCSYIALGVILNVVLVMTGIAFLYLLIKRLYGARYACLAVLACALFLPFYMHASIFYTDTFALPFVIGTFYCYLFRKKDSRFMILTAIVLAVGYKMKGSLGVILIALLIHIWLQKDAIAERMRKSLLLLVPFLLIVGFITVLPGKMSFLDMSQSEKNEFPVEHWVAMGLEGNGGYNSDVYWMTASVEGKEEKKAVDKAFISEKLEEYGIEGMKEHLKKKVLFTWGDGVYFASEKLYRDPVQESWMHDWVLYSGTNYSKVVRYCDVIQLLLFLGILLSLLRNFLEKGEVREIQAIQIAVFGLFLFLLIWETRSRYLLNFVPVFVLLGIDGIHGVKVLLERSREKARKE